MTDRDVAVMMGGLGVVFLVMTLVSVLLYIVPMWKIFSRTGQSGALSLLMLIPVVNIIMLFVLAFGNWPILQELEQYRAYYRNQGQPPQQ